MGRDSVAMLVAATADVHKTSHSIILLIVCCVEQTKKKKEKKSCSVPFFFFLCIRLRAVWRFDGNVHCFSNVAECKKASIFEQLWWGAFPDVCTGAASLPLSLIFFWNQMQWLWQTWKSGNTLVVPPCRSLARLSLALVRVSCSFKC